MEREECNEMQQVTHLFFVHMLYQGVKRKEKRKDGRSFIGKSVMRVEFYATEMFKLICLQFRVQYALDLPSSQLFLR